MATYVLVHGGWDGGWAWRAVLDQTGAGLLTSKTSKAWQEDSGISYPKTKAIIRLKGNG